MSEDDCDGRMEVGKVKTGEQARHLFLIESLYQTDHRGELLLQAKHEMYAKL